MRIQYILFLLITLPSMSFASLVQASWRGESANVLSLQILDDGHLIGPSDAEYIWNMLAVPASPIGSVGEKKTLQTSKIQFICISHQQSGPYPVDCTLSIPASLIPYVSSGGFYSFYVEGQDAADIFAHIDPGVGSVRFGGNLEMDGFVLSLDRFRSQVILEVGGRMLPPPVGSPSWRWFRDGI